MAGLVDLISLGLGIPWVGYLNYLFMWGTVHSLGYAWADSRLGSVGQSSHVVGGRLAHDCGVGRLGALSGGDGRSRHPGRHQQPASQGHPADARHISGRGSPGDGRTGPPNARQDPELGRNDPHQRQDHDPLPVAPHRHGGSHRRLAVARTDGVCARRRTLPPGG